MLLNIQKEIEALYQIECPASVDEFIMEDASRNHYISQIQWMSYSDETLLVYQSENEINVGLTFHPQLISWSKSLEWEDITPLLHKSYAQKEFTLLNRLSTLIEGVSHFIYLLWRNEYGQSVSQLELELQAEIDKFIIFSKLIPHPEKINTLNELLFFNVKWISNLSDADLTRYKMASKLASQYCNYLQKTYLTIFPYEKILPEIRKFYRLSQEEKIRRSLTQFPR